MFVGEKKANQQWQNQGILIWWDLVWKMYHQGDKADNCPRGPRLLEGLNAPDLLCTNISAYIRNDVGLKVTPE